MLELPAWSAPLADYLSRGRRAARPGSLAGLAAARKETLQQFLTPHALSALLWRIATPAMDAALARTPGSRVALLDTSCATGRLFQFADPDKHTLAGCDVDADALDLLRDAAEGAGFRCDLQHCGLEAVRPRNYAFGLLNPPFSIHLDTPLLAPLSCTTYGRFGPNSAAVSHEYALDAALAGCDCILALLPRNAAEARAANSAADTEHRLRAIVTLPTGTFRTEGTEADVALLVYGPPRVGGRVARLALATLDDALPDFELHCHNTTEMSARPLNLRAVQSSRPSITEPVTGDDTVRVTHHGRRIVLRYACGFARARIENALLRRPVRNGDDKHRYPKHIRFAGQGWFDLEAYFIQPDPDASFADFLNAIRSAGGTPIVDRGLHRHFAKRLRLRLRQLTPLGHVTRGAACEPVAGDVLQGTACKTFLVSPDRWGSALVRSGETHALTYTGTHYQFTHPTSMEVALYEPTAVRACFYIERATDANAWGELHPSREVKYPQLARSLRARLAAVGADAITGWKFQIADIVELLIGRSGTVAWEQGCGKSRAALLLTLMGGNHNLVVTEPYLIDEMLDQFREIGLDPALYQVIRRPDDCRSLRKINLISFNRLRQPVAEGARRTYAHLLRRRIATLVVDEADGLKNVQSCQSRAIAMVSARMKFAMSGTPVSNYVRDLMGVAQFCVGDGIASQPFGRFHPYLEPALLKSMDHAMIGADHFRERHSVLTWVTHQFMDSGMTAGGKREIPQVRNLAELRAWTAPWLKRRVTIEPDVAQHFTQASATVVTRSVDFDPGHLAHFVAVADDFRAWWVEQRRLAQEHGKNINMVAILARIGAVCTATSYPQHAIPGFGNYAPLTSKQRGVLDRLEEWTREGRKSICYVESPENAERFVRELAKRGIEAVPFHGQIPIIRRTKALNARFRYGPAPVLVASLGVCQRGLNISQASRVAFVTRSWTPKREQQAMKRVLRPQQTSDVLIEFWEIAGSIDRYMAQMVTFKSDATDSVVDVLEPQLDDAEFLHLDAILDAFVADLAARSNMTGSELRNQLKETIRDAA